MPCSIASLSAFTCALSHPSCAPCLALTHPQIPAYPPLQSPLRPWAFFEYDINDVRERLSKEAGGCPSWRPGQTLRGSVGHAWMGWGYCNKARPLPVPLSPLLDCGGTTTRFQIQSSRNTPHKCPPPLCSIAVVGDYVEMFRVHGDIHSFLYTGSPAMHSHVLNLVVQVGGWVRWAVMWGCLAMG